MKRSIKGLNLNWTAESIDTDKPETIRLRQQEAQQRREIMAEHQRKLKGKDLSWTAETFNTY